MRRGQVLVEKVPDLKLRVDAGDSAQVLRHPTHRGETAMVDDAVDDALLTTKATYFVNNRRVPLPPRVRRFAFDILTERAPAKDVYNGALVRQSADLDVAVLRRDGTVELGATDYYSLLCSNYMTDWRVRDRATGVVLLDGTSLVTGEQGRLRSLAGSELANAIGVSTLGFTSDHRMVLIRQHRLAQSSPDLYAPAGSGSMDFHDIESRSSRDLTALVARGMRRELCEECNLKPSELGQTEVTGYFRWLAKGAKPEYIGATRLMVTAETLRQRGVRMVETHYVREVDINCHVDFRRLLADPDSLACLPPAYRARASVPLFLCLRALGRILRRRDPDGKPDVHSSRLARIAGVDLVDDQ